MTRTPEESIALHPACCQLRIWGVYVLLPLCHFTDKAMVARERRLLLEPRKLSQTDRSGSKPRPPGSQCDEHTVPAAYYNTPPWKGTLSWLGLPVQLPFLSEQGSEWKQRQQELVPPVLMDTIDPLCPVLSSFLGVPPSSGPEHPWSVSPPPFSLGSPGTCPWHDRQACWGRAGTDANGGVSGTVNSRSESSALGQGSNSWMLQEHHRWVWDVKVWDV